MNKAMDTANRYLKIEAYWKIKYSSATPCGILEYSGISFTTYESFDVHTRLYCIDLLMCWTWIEQAMYPSNMTFWGIIILLKLVLTLNSRRG